MTDPRQHLSRRHALGTIATTVTAGLAGCNALSNDDSQEPNPPDYDPEAVGQIVRESFPAQPTVFPVQIPDSHFQAHASRTRDLLDSVPEEPNLPNGAIAKQIGRERAGLMERLGERGDEPTPRDRLGQWRYYRDHAAEVWGSYVAATGQYGPSEFRDRYQRLKSAYDAFESDWAYRGDDRPDALVVHATIEELFERGLDDVLSTGPFPSDPQAAVFEAGRMVREHERAAANLEDARMFRDRFIDDQSAPSTNRLAFAATSRELRREARAEAHRGSYGPALEDGRSALDANLARGPAGTAFEHARNTARYADRAVERATERNDPATAILRATHQRHAMATFRDVVDAIRGDELTWPEDASELRELRSTTTQAIQTAWSTSPEPLAVELTTHAVGLLRELTHYHDEHELDEYDLARYVGTLNYARQYAQGVPERTSEVVHALRNE